MVQKMAPTRVASPGTPSQVQATPRPLVLKRRQLLDEAQLAESLDKASHEIDLDKVAGTSAKLLTASTAASSKAVPDLVVQRSDLVGLPLRQASVCRLDENTAKKRQSLSVALRGLLSKLAAQTARVGKEGAVVYFEQELLYGRTTPSSTLESQQANRAGALEPGAWLQKEAISSIVQVLQGEDKLVRGLLIRILSRIDDPAATASLAQRALFDLSEEVREEAIRALSDRPRQECRQVLLAGLRHPWPPVADHAAEALVALRDREVLPRLVDLLNEPDPAAPGFGEMDKLTAPELVCVNHLRNCVLCHSPSSNLKDLIRAPVPTPGLPLSTRIYFESLKGSAIRADVTYLQQDFSVLRTVPNHGAWPELQRFDYLIRMRELTTEEVVCVGSTRKPASMAATAYPQRESVLFALRELSGRNCGTLAVAWKRDLAARHR